MHSLLCAQILKCESFSLEGRQGGHSLILLCCTCCCTVAVYLVMNNSAVNCGTRRAEYFSGAQKMISYFSVVHEKNYSPGSRTEEVCSKTRRSKMGNGHFCTLIHVLVQYISPPPCQYLPVLSMFCVLHLFAGKARLEYTCLAFTADGKKLATLSGIPDFLLTIW